MLSNALKWTGLRILLKYLTKMIAYSIPNSSRDYLEENGWLMGATAVRHALSLILRLFSEDRPLQGGPQWQSAQQGYGLQVKRVWH